MILYKGIVELEYVPYEGVYVIDKESGAYPLFDRDFSKKYYLTLESVPDEMQDKKDVS